MNKLVKLHFLDKYRKETEILNDLWERYNTLVSSIQNCQAIEYSDIHKESRTSDLSYKMVTLETLQERIKKWTEKTAEMKSLLIDEIDKYISVDTRMNDAVFMFYIEGVKRKILLKSWIEA